VPRDARFPIVALALLLSTTAHADEDGVRHNRLAASLFGETVGEIHLTLRVGRVETLTYRSNLLVVRDKNRLRQEGFIEASFDADSGQLIRSVARRCSGPADGSSEPVCSPTRELSHLTAAPALAAELLLSRAADDREHCLDIVDEETGIKGRACAVVKSTPTGFVLSGSKLGEAFEARVDSNGLISLELPRQGARFDRATGSVQVSDEDLFAAPIPSSGDVTEVLRAGHLRLRLFGEPPAMERLRGITLPWQTISEPDSGSLLVTMTQATLPKDSRSRKQLDKAAFLVAKAAGSHTDCQAASAWFIAEARKRHWKVDPAIGFAWVTGRFAFHSWAIVHTPGGSVPVDPLLAQVPADAGHVQLAPAGESAGAVLVSFHRGLAIHVE
jgi:hypothetical protein